MHHVTGNLIFNNPTDTTRPILELRANGDIYVRGSCVAHDIEIVDAMREIVTCNNVLKEATLQNMTNTIASLQLENKGLRDILAKVRDTLAAANIFL